MQNRFHRMFGWSIVAAFMLAGAAPLRAAETYKFDPPHSFLTFWITHFGAGHVFGRFNSPTGTMVYDASDPSKTTIEVEAQAGNIDTGVAKRDQHLKSPDFFNVEQFPTLSFKSTSVKQGADENELEVTGDLTIHGVTKSMTVAVKKLGEGKDPQGKVRVGWLSTFTIQRSDFGMDFMPGGVGDDVHITVALEGIRQ